MGIKDIVNAISREIEVLKGDETKDSRFSSEQTFPDERSAEAAFIRSAEKLLAVNGWSDLPGLTSSFQLHDPAGKPKPAGRVEEGDYVKIVLPGPAPENWVRVTRLESDRTRVQFVVHPSASPLRPEGTAPVEHFFDEQASSTFRVERLENRIVATEIGRNERINNQGPQAGDRPVINTLIAEGGWALFQEVQWKKLTDYLVAYP